MDIGLSQGVSYFQSLKYSSLSIEAKGDKIDIKFEEFNAEVFGVSENNFLSQIGLNKKSSESFDFEKINEILKNIDVSKTGYKGKNLTELSKEEATKLVSEDGFFGVKQTSERIADFVLAGAGDDVKMLRAGREGVLRGFKEAEDMWGDSLPDISKETIKKAVEKIDEKLKKLGVNTLDESI